HVHQPFLVATEARRPEPVAVAGALEVVGRPTLDQYQCDQQPRPGMGGEARRHPRQPPIERGAVAQHGIDMLRDRSAVLHAGEAVTAVILRHGVIGRRATSVDRVEKLDGGFDAGARGQSPSPRKMMKTEGVMAKCDTNTTQMPPDLADSRIRLRMMTIL